MRHQASWIRAVLGWGAGTLATAAGFFLPTNARACSVCVGWTEGQGLNGGFYWSALLLTALPLAVVAVIGAWLGYAARASRPRRPQATGTPEPREKR